MTDCFFLIENHVCLPNGFAHVSVQAVSAQKMLENPDLQLLDLIFMFLSYESEKMVNFLGKQLWEQLLFGFIST